MGKQEVIESMKSLARMTKFPKKRGIAHRGPEPWGTYRKPICRQFAGFLPDCP
jgi:hypothetical protein